MNLLESNKISAKLPTKFGNFKVIAFDDKSIALMKGGVNGSLPVRIHSGCLTGDVFSSLRCDCREQLEKSMRYIEAKGRGIILYLDQEGRGIGLFNKIRAYAVQERGYDTVEANELLGFDGDERGYEKAARMLKSLGVGSVELLTNNPKKVEELRSYGIEVTRRIPLITEPNRHNAYYLKAKGGKLGHMIDDNYYMSLALELAKRANPSPNPRVGAVIVKDGRILSVGYHRKAGMPHAEVEALGNLKDGEAKGSTLYVTLEPCSHEDKRTPPCTHAIIKAGIKRVVIGARDVNSRVKGIEELRAHGIKVDVGILESDAKEMNERYEKKMREGMPFVTLKSAISLDGKIAMRSGESRWITGREARAYAHRLRDEYDGIVVGINTVLKDNPRLRGVRRNPVRIILDSRLRIPMSANVLGDRNVVIATSERYDRRKAELLGRKGIRILISGKKEADMRKLMRMLLESGINSILIEGGGSVNASALKSGIVDKVLLFIAPKIMGSGGIDAVNWGIREFSGAIKLKEMRFERIGKDFLVEGKVKK